MNIMSSVYVPTRAPQVANSAAVPASAAQTEAAPAESFQRSSEALPTLYARDSRSKNIGKAVAAGLAGATLGGGLVGLAASQGGTIGGIAGALALAAPAATLGFFGAGIAIDQSGNHDASSIIGGAIWGGLGGGAIGITAGALLGSSGAAGAAVGLAVAGAVAGGYYGVGLATN